MDFKTLQECIDATECNEFEVADATRQKTYFITKTNTDILCRLQPEGFTMHPLRRNREGKIEVDVNDIKKIADEFKGIKVIGVQGFVRKMELLVDMGLVTRDAETYLITDPETPATIMTYKRTPCAEEADYIPHNTPTQPEIRRLSRTR